jgi:hypothetical protein
MTIKEALHQLRECGAIGLKAGFEAEGQSLDEVVRMSTLDPALPVTVKIGGPEARTDLRNLVDWSIFSFVAPMVESPFAVLKTVQNAAAITEGDLSLFRISLNIESVAAHVARQAILRCEAAKSVSKVNVGRTDLAASIGVPVEYQQVLQMTRDIVDEARLAGKTTGVGGSLTPATIEKFLAACQVDEFETRHVIFRTNRVRDAHAAVMAALDFELVLLDWLNAPWMRGLKDAQTRSQELRRRLSRPVAE